MDQEFDSLGPEDRAYAWQRIHGVSAAEAVELADRLPTIDPRRVHLATFHLAEWREGREAS